MKKVREDRLHEIEGFRAWIEPSFECLGTDGVYKIRIHNGYGVVGDFKVLSNMVSANIAFYCGSARTPQQSWESSLRVDDLNDDHCPIGPIASARPIQLEISQVDLRLLADVGWRPPSKKPITIEFL